MQIGNDEVELEQCGDVRPHIQPSGVDHRERLPAHSRTEHFIAVERLTYPPQ